MHPTDVESPSPSGPSLAHRAAAASRMARLRSPDRPPHLAMSRPIDYSEEESEFLKAACAYRARHNLKHLTVVQCLAVAKSIGYIRHRRQ